MALPMENEATIRRRILNVCQDYARSIVSVVRELSLMIDWVVKEEGEKAKEHYEKMLSLIDESDRIKHRGIEEVASVGALLVSREAFLSLIFELSKIADNAEAAGYRLMGLVESGWKVKLRRLEGLSEFASMVLDEIVKLRETMISLNFNYEKALEMAKMVEESEKKIDSVHRKLDLAVLSSGLPPPALLLARDVMERVENISDLGIDIIDVIRLIAISP